MERNTNKVLLTIIGVAVLIVATVGATFAYFSATGGSQTQNVKTGELKIAATSSLVDGDNIKPTEWVDATTADDDADVAKVGLEVKTDGTTIDSGKYDILLTTTGIQLNTANEGGKLSDVKWALYDNTDLTQALNEGSFDNGNVTDLVITDAQISIPAAAQNTDNYTLYIWIENTEDSEDEEGNPVSGAQDQLQGLSIKATLAVNAIQ